MLVIKVKSWVAERGCHLVHEWRAWPYPGGDAADAGKQEACGKMQSFPLGCFDFLSEIKTQSRAEREEC